MKLKLICIFSLVISSLITAQIKHVSITIKVFSTSLSQSDKIYISGNNEQLGNWSPKKIKLTLTNNHWEGSFKFPQNTIIEFKFTKGTWESEALNDNGRVSGNNILQVINDTTLNYTINNWRDEDSINLFKGQVTGKVVYHRQLTFSGLLPRDVIVWLPPGYSKNYDERYPVLYMQDGQNLFDPTTSFTGIDWQIDETADSLIRNNIIDPIIIVGINNTKDRSEEYSPTEKGIKYMQFVVTKLKPFIDSTYRTLPERMNTAVGGSSSGGLISFMLAWNYSKYFSKAACFSPAFKYDNFNYTKVIKEYYGMKKDILLYIDNGGIGLEKELLAGADLMKNILVEKGFRLYNDLFVNIDLKAEHNEKAWAKRVHLPLKLFFGLNNKINVGNKLLNIEKRKKNISNKRFRFQFSTSTTLDDDDFIINIPYIFNINYRNSQLDSSELISNSSFSFSTEVGINIFPDPTIVIPYAKVGPEIRILKKIYFDFHAGIGLIVGNNSLEYIVTPLPFIGSEIGYIYSISNNHSLELELGINGLPALYLYYLGLSFSFY